MDLTHIREKHFFNINEKHIPMSGPKTNLSHQKMKQFQILFKIKWNLKTSGNDRYVL